MKTTDIKSIAVLPFSSQIDAYLGEGIAEEIINALSKLDGLQVTARSSSFAFKHKNLDGCTIGKMLNVNAVIEGNLQKVGEQIRVSAQLVRVENSYPYWSEIWERDWQNVFGWQNEIAALIAAKLQKEIAENSSKIPARKAGNVETAAYDAYLQSKYYFHQFYETSTHKAIECLEKALKIAPDFALAHSGLADCYAYLGAVGFERPQEAFPKAQAFAKKALALDANLPESHLALAAVHFWYEWDGATTLLHINNALTISPSFARAHQLQGIVQMTQSNYSAAMDTFNRALQLDPLSEQIQYCKATAFYLQENYAKAIVICNNVLNMNPYFASCTMIKGLCLSNIGSYEQAIPLFSHIPVDIGKTITHEGGLGFAYAKKGDVEQTKRSIALLEQLLETRQRTQMIYYLALIYNVLGNYEKALDYLEIAVAERASILMLFKNDVNWNNLKNHARYQKLIGI